jgi:para-nitrobenzyl esterase
MGSVVTTQQGRIAGGKRRDAEFFLGIPFARPPVGPLRFHSPTPAHSWPGVREALSIGPSAPQIGPVSPIIRTLIGAAGSKQSQDCLYLNVWTPRADNARRPVMVWIHGGAFILGSGSTPLYAGWRLAQRGDVVVVTLNYRLGALGFLSWKGLADGPERPPANLGLLDQIAALEWVRDNIEGFGGDPENVTLFGESAGAMSIGTLLGTPRAKGLFHRAILQSGAAHNVFEPDLADRVAQTYVEALGLKGAPTTRLAQLSVTELMRAQARTSASIGLADGAMAWQPCVDGELLTEQPLAAIQSGLSAAVPTLIGTNRDEWKLFMVSDRMRLSERKLHERLRRLLPGCNADGEDYADLAAAAYATVKGVRGAEPAERWAGFQTDRIFHYPAACLADRQSDHQKRTYAYLFEWAPPIVGRWLGACHGLEIPFVFGGLRAALMRAGLVASPGAQRLCDQMQDAWIAFARTGSPEHEGLPDWPAYSRDSRYTMALGPECSLREDIHKRRREFWDQLGRGAEARRA